MTMTTEGARILDELVEWSSDSQPDRINLSIAYSLAAIADAVQPRRASTWDRLCGMVLNRNTNSEIAAAFHTDVETISTFMAGVRQGASPALLRQAHAIAAALDA